MLSSCKLIRTEQIEQLSRQIEGEPEDEQIESEDRSNSSQDKSNNSQDKSKANQDKFKMTTYIRFFYHTQGRFERDENRRIQYLDGKVDSIPPMDIDEVNYLDLVACFKDLGYADLKSVYWMRPGQTCFNTGLTQLVTDNDINRMCEAAMAAMGSSGSCECSMHLYFEHPVLGVEDIEVVDPIEPSDENEFEEVQSKKGARKVAATEKKGARMVAASKKKGARKVAASKKKGATKEKAVLEEPDSDHSVQMSFEINGYDSYSEQMKTPESTDDEANSRPTFPVFRESAAFGEVNLEVGMEFDNLEIFKNAVRDFTIDLGREIKWKKNDKIRARAVCCVDGCPWVAFCSWSSLDNTYQVKTLILEHTCCRVFKNKAATRGWVAAKLEKKLVTQPDLKKKSAFEIMKEDFSVHLSDKKVSRALKKARLAVEGSEKEHYGRTWDYLGEILRSNPGSTAKMDVSPRDGLPPLFDRLYICLDACKKGFKAGCRPLIGLDGCFLKGYYGGQLLSAVAQDANNQFYVIVVAVVDAETKENWKWFLTLLLADLGDYRTYGWNFTSDQQKGLLPALSELMPGVHHRNCVVHIWKNFIKQWKDKELRGIVWECSRCTTEAEFKAAMLRLKTRNEKAWSYLNNIDPHAWVKAYFSHWPKVDNITNNNCEIWHSKIVREREKPILTMLEEVRCYMMRRMASHKRVLGSHSGKLPPVQQKKIDKLKVKSNYWTPTWNGNLLNESYEVRRSNTKVGVSLTNHTCACQMWQLTGMPCCHAIAAIAHKNEKPEDYVHQWLTMDALNATYNYYIQPVNSQEFWAVTDHPKPDPPKLKRPIGRPKKQRRKDSVSEDMPGRSQPSSSSQAESGQQHKVKRRFEVRCTKCGEAGHNERTCKGPAQPQHAKRRAAAKKKTVPQEQQSFDNPPQQPQPPAVRPPPIRPRAPRAPHTPLSTPPPYNPIPSSAVGTQTIRPPGPPVRPFNPPRYIQNEGDPITAPMEFQFMPTPGYKSCN